MAHILNQKERSQAFLKFLFFFVLSTSIIVAAVYFDTRIPTKDNQLLREQASRYKTQEMAQEKFVRSMDEAKQLIDSLSKPGTNSVWLNEQIAAKIRTLADLRYGDSSIFSRLNRNVVDVFLRYQQTTNASLQTADLPQQVADWKAKYEQSQRDLLDAQQALRAYQQTSGTGF